MKKLIIIAAIILATPFAWANFGNTAEEWMANKEAACVPNGNFLSTFNCTITVFVNELHARITTLEAAPSDGVSQEDFDAFERKWRVYEGLIRYDELRDANGTLILDDFDDCSSHVTADYFTCKADNWIDSVHTDWVTLWVLKAGEELTQAKPEQQGSIYWSDPDCTGTPRSQYHHSTQPQKAAGWLTDTQLVFVEFTTSSSGAHVNRKSRMSDGDCTNSVSQSFFSYPMNSQVWHYYDLPLELTLAEDQP